MFDFPEPFNPVIALKCGSNLCHNNVGFGCNSVNGMSEFPIRDKEKTTKDTRSLDQLTASTKHYFLPLDDRPVGIRLEAIDHNFLNVHGTDN